MSEMAVIMPIVAASVGALVAVLCGMILSKLNGIQAGMSSLNDRFFQHVTSPHIHEAGFAKTDQQIANLVRIAEVAHERIDKLEGVR